MVDTKLKRLKFIGCEVLYREACYLAASSPHRVDVQFLRKGLHDLEKSDMLSQVQAAIDAAEADGGYEAILLGYARCNDGLAGTTARSIPLVLPRAHDCITLFFGSRQAYKEYFDDHPGTFYATTGWLERDDFLSKGGSQLAGGQSGVMAKLGLADSYEQMVAKYGKENADFIVQSIGDWRKNYSRMLYIRMDVCDETSLIEYAGLKAAENSWEFHLRQGDLSLLRKLFWGQWDQDFLVVPPGGVIVARNDEQIVDCKMSGAR